MLLWEYVYMHDLHLAVLFARHQCRAARASLLTR